MSDAFRVDALALVESIQRAVDYLAIGDAPLSPEELVKQIASCADRLHHLIEA